MELLPDISTTSARQALVYSAGLDGQLSNRIHFDGSTTQFCQLLVSTLSKYGRLEDDRGALEAVLEAAKKHIGQEKQVACDEFIEALKTF